MVDTKKLTALNQDIKDKGRVDREHLLEFLRLIPTSDAEQILAEVKQWLQGLHDDPTYDKIYFPNDDIRAILVDLSSYDRLLPNTILGLQESTSHELRAS